MKVSKHISQARNKGRDSYCVTYHDAIIMRWNKKQQQRSDDPMEPDIAALADEIWVELAEATHVEPPIQIKMYYDKTVKREDPENNKVLVDFK